MIRRPPRPPLFPSPPLFRSLAARAASGLGWGAYAILYRRHKVGEYLEGRLVRAGIPCRLARGRSLVEDDVIKYVIAALGIVRDPGDPVALEAFARCVLSPHFLQEVEAATSAARPGSLSTTSAPPPSPLPPPGRGGKEADLLAGSPAPGGRRPGRKGTPLNSPPRPNSYAAFCFQ